MAKHLQTTFSNLNGVTRLTQIFCAKSARKRIVPPIECELSFSIGTVLNNYDAIDGKLKPLLIGSTVGKREKWEENTIVETTSLY